MRVFIFLLILCSAPLSTKASNIEIGAARRLAVFPIASDDLPDALKSSLWWELRKDLSKSARFVVASKQFLELKEVYQSRKSLSPSDAVLLAKHLEADLILSLEYSNRELQLRTYSKEDGMILSHLTEIVPNSFTAKSRLSQSMKNLVNKWYASLPAQGHSSKWSENEVLINWGKQKTNSQIKDAFLIKVERTGLGPLKKDNHKITRMAELKFIEKSGDHYRYEYKALDLSFKPGKNMHATAAKRQAHLQKKALGISNSISTDNMLHELQSSSDEKKEDETGKTKIYSLVNLLIIIALSL